MNTAFDAGRPHRAGVTAPRGTASTADLARAALEQAARLVRAESRAGLAELKPKFRDVGTGLALFGVAGVSALYGVAVLLATLTLLLALLLPAWAAALVVTAVLFAATGATALAGMVRLRRAGPLIPDKAVESIRSDLRAIGTAAQRRSGAPSVARISAPVRRHPVRWAAAGAGVVAVGAVVATGVVVASLRRRRARRTPPAPAVPAWRTVVRRLGR